MSCNSIFDNEADSTAYTLQETDTVKKYQQAMEVEDGFCGGTSADAPPPTPIEFVQIYSGFLVQQKSFKNTMIGLIILNSILMGVGTYFNPQENPVVDNVFEMVDTAFLCIFTFELALQFVHHGVWQLFSDGWLTFDFWVIALSWAFSSLQVVRAFRIVRAARLVTKIAELKRLVQALIAVIPKMFAIGILMCLVFYVFGVMFTQLFHTSYEDGITDQDYFSALHRTLFTLFQLMTMENWSAITRDLMTVYPWAWLPMICFVLVSSFIVINLVIAVICDAVAGMHQGEREQDLVRIESFVTQLSEQKNGIPKQVRSISQTQEDTDRLEQKIDRLTELVHDLMQQQQQLQQQQQQQPDTLADAMMSIEHFSPKSAESTQRDPPH